MGYSDKTLIPNVTNYTDAGGKWIGGETTLYTKWTGRTYTVTLDDNGGSSGSGTITVTYGSPMPAIKIPTRTGYTFNGYWTGKTTQSTQYYDANGNSLKNWDKAGNTTTLYAHWTANTNTPYVVKHYKEQLDGTYSAEADDTDNLTGTTAASVTPAVKSYEGFTAPSTQTVSINADGSTVVTYQYTRNSYNLSWNVNEGDALTGEYTFGIVKYEAAITQPNTPTRTGYTFIGWSPAEIPATMPANNLEFIAQWAAIHSVTWIVNGSQAEGDPTTSVVNGQTITTLPTTPDVDCNGKVFVGWTTATIHGETAIMPDPLYTELGAFPAVTSNMTFYAVFANGSGEERWVETEIGQIQSGDEVIITMTKGNYVWTISNEKHTSSTAPTTVDISANVEGQYLTTVNDGNKWVIEKNNDNLTFYSYTDQANYLYCINDDNGVRVGTGDAKEFVVDGNYLKNTQTKSPRYIGVSLNTNPYSWRCYTETTGVILDQTLKLYKKTTVYTSYTNYSTSCIDGVCDITNANPIYVTSAVGQKIKATEKLVLTTTDMAVDTEISLSAPNITFYKEGVEITQLTTTAASETFELEIAYQPTIANTTEQPTITLEILGFQFAFNNKIIGRSLPENFAIVAKVGNMWYALPEIGYEAEKHATAYPVEVNDIADPTEVTSALANNATWSLRQVYQAQHSNAQHDRYVVSGANVVFENKQNPAKLLNASAQGDKGSNNYLLTSAQYDNYYSTNPGLYEWTPTTTDLETYTLTNVQRTDKQINISTNAAFGLHASDVVTNQVRFLPITGTYTTLATQVVEWKENSVVIMYNGAPTQTAQLSINATNVGSATLSSVQKDIAVYELPATGLAANPGQMLKIAIGSEQLLLSIPYIISEATNDVTILGSGKVAERQAVAKVSDLVILKGGTLTADGAKTNYYKFRNVTIYGGGKLVIPSDKGFGVTSLTLRSGGVTDDGKYDYVYPEFELNINYTNAFTNTSAVINLDYVTTKDQYYTFVAPFEVKTKDIKYPIDIYGSNVDAANRGSFEFQYYDGEARAEGTPGWKVVEEDPTDGATLTAHKGYTFLGMPKKVNGTRQKFGIHRIPMSVTAANAMSHETTEQTVAVSPHPSKKNNNSGWNLIGNPYMSTIGGLTNDDIQVGKLVHINDAQGNWTGKWQWDDTNPTTGQRFLVFPSNDGQSYEAVQASNATLPAFKNFFVQIGNENATALSIPRTTPAAQLLAPVRRTAEEIAQDIELAIVLEQDAAHSDQMDFLINEIYSAEFDRNADFTKMLNATNLNLYGVHPYDNLSFVAIDSITARGSVAIGYQVPQAGEYTLRISDKPYVMFDKIEALYVTDHEASPEITTNILEEDYIFQVADAETNNTRFTISIQLKQEENNTDDGNGDTDDGNTDDGNTDGGNDNDDIITALHHLHLNSEQPQKFIYKDQLYILRNGAIYNAMGKQILSK